MSRNRSAIKAISILLFLTIATGCAQEINSVSPIGNWQDVPSIDLGVQSAAPNERSAVITSPAPGDVQVTLSAQLTSAAPPTGAAGLKDTILSGDESVAQ